MYDIISFEFDIELDPISGNITWFEDVLTNYSHNVSPKLQLANQISASMTSSISELLESLKSKMDLLAFEPMRNRIRTTKLDIRNW